MRGQNKLLSIGDISKLTGASIKALRYYDRIKLLEPAYVDPDSKYRYYTFDQIDFIGIIMFCVELDIPLSELTEFIDKNKTIDFSALLAYGKEIAEKKFKKLERGLRLISSVEQKIALANEYKDQPIYKREIPEKIFYVVPVHSDFEEVDLFKVILNIVEAFKDLGYSDDDYDDPNEYGSFYEYSPSGVLRYAFLELPPNHKERVGENIKIIPGGTYLCTQGEEKQIENAPQVFGEHFHRENSFIAIETEIYTNKYEIKKPVNELRIIYPTQS